MSTSVYAIGFENQEMPTKIGIAKCINSRLRGLQTSSPWKLKVYREWKFDTREVAQSIETTLHYLFSKFRTESQNEWFNMKPDHLDYFVHYVSRKLQKLEFQPFNHDQFLESFWNQPNKYKPEQKFKKAYILTSWEADWLRNSCSKFEFLDNEKGIYGFSKQGAYYEIMLTEKEFLNPSIMHKNTLNCRYWIIPDEYQKSV